MAIKDYTIKELQSMILEQANNIKGLDIKFAPEHAVSAYEEAVMECGFEIPAESDNDRRKKMQWLILRMRRWFLWQLWQQYSLMFQGGDFNAQQIAFNLQKLVENLDKAFEAAKSAPETAALFIDAKTVFGTLPLVSGTGFAEDRIGQDSRIELDARRRA